MQSSQILALSGAVLALAVTPAVASASAAGAGATTVVVRVEGKTRTLLASRNVKTHTGSITKGGTPAGVCPATTAAGALDRAAHGRWDGSYGHFGLSVTSIFGERHAFTTGPPATAYYWSIWVDNQYAPAGICGLKLRRGEQLLFAAVPDKGTVLPIVLTGPRHATAGHRFTVKATYYNSSGVLKPLAQAHVAAGSASATTSARGTASFIPVHPGKLKLRASRTGYIRSATVSVRVVK